MGLAEKAEVMEYDAPYIWQSSPAPGELYVAKL